MKSTGVVPIESVSGQIRVVRGLRVLLDGDLAALCDVETRALVQAVKRNAERFPPDFMFQLSAQEWKDLRSQSVISSWGGRRTAPYAFTEHGALQLASVLRSERAVEMSILVVRAFVRLRELLATHKELAAKLSRLERKLDLTDEAVAEIYALIKKLMVPPPEPPKRRIGF